jgi:hypothetical protein
MDYAVAVLPLNNAESFTRRSIVQAERLAEHLLPLLLLCAGQHRLDLAFVILANLHQFGPDLLRMTAGLGPLHQNFRSRCIGNKTESALGELRAVAHETARRYIAG